MGSREGAIISAARRIGCTPEEWKRRRAAGERWCGTCRTWRQHEAMGTDASRPDKVAVRCKQCSLEETQKRRRVVT